MFSPPPFASLASHAIIYTDTNAYLPSLATFVSSLPSLAMFVSSFQIDVSVAVKQLKAGFLLQRY